jgi:hypothetical protein
MLCTKCKKIEATESKKWCKECRQKHATYMNKWYKLLPEDRKKVIREGFCAYGKKHRTNDNKRHIKCRRKVKQTVIAAYGGKCLCCGETEIKFLTLHHPNEDGGQHRKELGVKAGVHYYRKIIKLGCPPGLVEVWCFNCHMAERTEGGCPHKNPNQAYIEEKKGLIEGKTVAEWAKEIGITKRTLYNRLKKMSPLEAIKKEKDWTHCKHDKQ